MKNYKSLFWITLIALIGVVAYAFYYCKNHCTNCGQIIAQPVIVNPI
jgi:hypothetical protein